MYLPMTHPTWLPENGQLLQRLRQKAGLDAFVFARMNTISTAQLKELETGLGNSFYNAQIKRSTGFKLLKNLGYVEVIQAPALADAAESKVPVLQPPIDIPPERPLSAVIPESRDITAPVNTRKLFRYPFFLAIAFISLVALYFFAPNWRGESAIFLQIGQPPSPPHAPSALSDTSTGETVHFQPNSAFKKPLTTTELGQTVQSLANSPELPDVSTALPSPISLAPISCADRYRQSSVAHTPTEPLRAGDYIFFEALENSQLCVLDAQNKLTTVQLDAGMKRRISGEAPFLVHTSNWQHLKMFYQGRRVQTGDSIQQHMVLNSQFFAP
jgi:hypothetical protein